MSFNAITSEPIRWRDADHNAELAEFLGDLQANILKGHGRHHAAHVFVSFGAMPPRDIAALLRHFGGICTSALQQLRGNRRYPPHIDGGPVRCLFLTAKGYRALAPLAKMPAGNAFSEGMAARGGDLADPPTNQWDRGGEAWADPNLPLHAMFLLADSSDAAVRSDVSGLIRWLNGSGARLLTIEYGNQQTRRFETRPEPEGVEHFGYVDGRSQPLFLAEDLDGEPKYYWDPTFPPSQFIVHDDNGGSLSGGSYFVFRKLEQNVRGFKKAEKNLGRSLFPDGIPALQGLPPSKIDEFREKAGAMIVGRFEDGAPLAVTGQTGQEGEKPPNDFNFDGDQTGEICPFHAHIRKTNPRGDVDRHFHTGPSGDRSPIMARRGITYGVRQRNSTDDDFADEGIEPDSGVGLLFMAYMASVEGQFEFTQKSWANNPDFVQGGTGIDPVIGQGDGRRSYSFPVTGFIGAQPGPFTFDQFVHLKGGAYFFAPSLSFLRTVGLP